MDRLSADRIGIAVAAVGAILSVAWAYVGVRAVFQMLDQNGGAFGSGSEFRALEYVTPLLATLWLRGRVTSAASGARLFRRLYLFATFGLLAVFLSFATQLFFDRQIFANERLDWTLLVATFIGTALWLPVQTFFASIFIGLLIGRQSAVP
ncbi:MAG TPA: hypothetical protein VGJ29_06565 [Vicinamibacterales bacterium]|jgi:hypothetical protein